MHCILVYGELQRIKPDPSFINAEHGDVFGGGFEFGKPSLHLCDVIGHQMQSLKDAAPLDTPNYENGVYANKCLIVLEISSAPPRLS